MAAAAAAAGVLGLGESGGRGLVGQGEPRAPEVSSSERA
jgi:hypothetical protein